LAGLEPPTVPPLLDCRWWFLDIVVKKWGYNSIFKNKLAKQVFGKKALFCTCCNTKT
jgi:hypothetical protein